MEKHAGRSEVRQGREEDDSRVSAEDQMAPNWHPSYTNRFPWLGICAMVGVFICACVAIAVLMVSDGTPSTRWPKWIAPNVVLSAINALSNLSLAVAITEGIAIAWWRKALKGATVADLHRSWLFSISTETILFNLGRLDVIALAALAMKLAIVDSVLLQRATSTYVAQDDPALVTMVGVAASEFPQTGFVLSEGVGAQLGCDCYMIGDTYTPVVNRWETSNGFFYGYHELFHTCNGVCYTHLEAPGFEIDCQKSNNHSDIAVEAIAAWKANNNGTTGDKSQWTELGIFNSSFYTSLPDETADYARIHLNLKYFQSDDPYNPSSASCPGTTTTVQCQLRPAMIRYPINIMSINNVHVLNGVRLRNSLTMNMDNADDGIAQMYSYELKQAEGFEVLKYLNPAESSVVNSTTALGGIANALSQFLSSTAAITYNGGALWSLRQQGTLAQTEMYGPPNMGSCDCSFSDDALSKIVGSINDLTFLTMTGLIDRTSYMNATVQSGTKATVVEINSNTTAEFAVLPGTLEVQDVIFYHTNKTYMGLGVAFMLICVLLVIPAYWGYGQLGRKVTMGPMEVAGAFGAPMLAKSSTGEHLHGDVNEIIRKVGDRKVQYGFVDEETETSSSSLDEDQISPVRNRFSVKLTMDEPAKVRPASGVWSGPTTPLSPRFGHRASGLWSKPAASRIDE